MGGGDLNLKKSWHPSTMKNMEKVWKAEQQDNQEKKRIAELKKEIAMERDKEEMKAFAMEQGVIEKKDDKKLDWMYKGPHETVNREEYLLGRPIDKQFEQMAQNEKDIEQNKPIKNHVEHECIPPSLRFFSGNEQVDLARKLQEDPLYTIKKKELETRSQLLKNPVKLKQLQLLVAQQKLKSKENKKKKKKKKKKKSSNSDDIDVDKKLDELLAAKYKKLKDEINEEDLLRSVKKHKKNKKTKKRKREKSSSDNDNSADSDSSSEDSSSSSSDSSSNRTLRRKLKKYKMKNGNKKYERKNHSNREIEGVDDTYENTKHKRKKQKIEESSRNPKYSRNRGDEEEDNSRYKSRNYGLMKADGSRVSPHKRRQSPKEESKSNTEKKEQKWVPYKKQKLSEEEKERRRQEMLDNASWRDKERKQNVKKYEEQERLESSKSASFDKNFVQKHLAIAANQETVASRIKSNINNIQRYKHSMDKNFAKR